MLERDRGRRAELVTLYENSLEYLRRLPALRRKELEQNVDRFESRLLANIESLKKSDCAILVAGVYQMNVSRRSVDFVYASVVILHLM